MTWEEVCADPALQELPYKIELNQWGNIEMSPARNRHGQYQFRIGHLLQLQRPDGLCITDCAVETAENVKVPDVAWISHTRHQGMSQDAVFAVAPEICVDMSSPANHPDEQMHKGQLYLQAGAEEFWLCNEHGEMRFFDVTGPLEHSRRCPEFPQRVEIPE
jgi:Uma2 family endonuclease